MSKSFLAALLLAAANVQAAPPLEGRVTEVVDGATLSVSTTDGRTLQLRLAGVVPPAPCQPWAAEAREALLGWTKDEVLTIKLGARDRGGWTLASVFVDGDDIGRRMVAEGNAWSQRSKWDRGPYVKEERMAHSLHRGFNTLGGTVETPAEFLRSHGACAPAAR